MILRSWFRPRVRLMQQMEAAECGIASLAMVADYLGARHSLPEVRRACGSSRDGNSALDLLRGARELGLEGGGVKIKIELLPRLRTPAILHWYGSHFVVLEGTDGSHAMLADPASGKRRVPLAEVERALSGTALELWRGPAFRRKRRVSRSRATYLAALLTHKLALAFVLVAGVAEQVLAVVAPAADQFLVDQVVTPLRHTWLLPVLAILFLCACGQFVLERLHGVGQVLLNSTLGIQLSRQIAERMVRLPLPFLESRSHGDLLSRVQLQSTLQSLISATAKGVLDLVFAALLSLLLVAYDSALGALSLAFSALNIVIIRLCRQIMEQRASAEVAASARTESALVEATSALEMIKGFGAENQMAQRYGARVTERARLRLESARFGLMIDGAMSLLGSVMQSAILWFGGQRVIDGEMTVGVFMGFLAIRGVLAAPIGSLLHLAESWLRVGGTLDRSDDILCEPTTRSGSHVAAAIQGRLVAHNVGFRYGTGGRWLFRSVNLCIEPGQHVAIIGPSGHGKSTLAKLLAGLLEPSEGHVTLDGLDIRDYDREALARSLGVVLQVPLIFDGSVLDAVRSRDPAASHFAVVEAAELACLDRVVARLPEGYHSRVKANGANLSGGERQRLALAQALLGRPQLLFLDEGTCSLDGATEERVLASIDQLPSTVVSVAHRESVIVRAQRVIRVEGGSVSEQPARPSRLVASQRCRSLPPGAPPQRHGSPHAVSFPRPEPMSTATTQPQPFVRAAFASHAPTPPEAGSPLDGTGAFYRRVLRDILRERFALRWLVACGLVQALLGLGTPWLLARVIDTALPNQASNQLLVLLVLTIVGALHLGWCGWAHGKALLVLQQRVVCACQEGVLRRFLRTRYALSQRQSFGETNITLNAVATTVLAILDLVLGLGTTVLMALGATAVVAVSFPALALIAVSACVAMALCASVFALREAKLSKATLAAAGVEYNWLHVLLSAVPTLRASGATSRAMQHWTQLVYRTARAGLEQTRNNIAQGIVLQAVPQLLCMGTSMWLMSGVVNGTTSLGTVMMVNALLGSLTHSAVAVVRAMTGLQRLRPQFERIDELLVASDASPERSAWRPLESTSPGQDAIVCEDLWFRYSADQPWVLQGHTQSFAAETVTYLRAESGAGKTTLLRVAAGLLIPERGRVRVLGLDPSVKRGLVTYLPQNAVLLEASISTNLTLLSGQPIECVLQVAELTGLSRLLAQLPLGLATPVSLRGGNISAGQCQLIVLTAAFASASPVVLLDEATAQIDIDTRSRIDWASLTQGRCVIVVTHE